MRGTESINLDNASTTIEVCNGKCEQLQREKQELINWLEALKTYREKAPDFMSYQCEIDLLNKILNKIKGDE